MKKSHLVFILFFASFLIDAKSQIVTNQLDANGKKHGPWKGIYEVSKRPRYEGTFSHGKEVGLFIYFDDTKSKSIIATREFNDKEDTAFTIFYDKNNIKVSEGKVVNKLYEGLWKYYHKASTAIMTIENYKNGKLEGLRSVYYPDGKLAEETQYSNDLKNGFSKIYTQNGIIIEEAFYRNNVYHGFSIFRDSEGNLASKGNFSNGRKIGIWQFYEKGKLVKETNMSFPERKLKKK